MWEAKMNYHHILITLIGSLLIGVPFAVAEEAPSHRGHSDGPTSRFESGSGICQPPQIHGRGAGSGRLESAMLEGVQIETSDIQSHELFFETILKAQPILRIDHPQVDHLRGYCYRDVLIIVRQDLKTARPTGWIQVNFSVSDVAAVKEEIERALQASPVAQRGEAERSKVVRIRLKPDVPRSNCRAVRLEVGGPEGFMIGFDQFKEGSCKTDARSEQTEKQEQ
jgi:hypothetical protein